MSYHISYQGQRIRKLLSNWHIAGLLVFLFFGACNESKLNLERYYYPFEELTQGKVYVYVPVGPDSVHPVYWHFQTTKTDSGRFLKGMYLDEFFQVRQIIQEKWVNEGVLMKHCRIFEPDTLFHFHSADLQFEYNAGFPFVINDTNQVFLYKATFTNPLDSLMKTTLIRNRRYTGSGNVSWKGKDLPTANIELKEIIETRKDGIQELKLEGSEIYAQGLGLVEYRKRLNQQTEIHFRLKDIYSSDQIPKPIQASIQHAL